MKSGFARASDTWPRSPVSRRRRNRNRLSLLMGIFIVLGFFYECVVPSRRTFIQILHTRLGAVCPQSSIANEILLVIRTGATETLTKLPVHFDTTLRCVPDYVLYSDYEEDIRGHQIYDVFEGVSKNLLETVPEFELYKQFKAQGRQGINSTTTFGSDITGSDNQAWKLDRFKFLPMVEKALQHRPNAKWFFFIEADTYLVWSNLIEYLSHFDPAQDIYLGRQMYIGEVLFGHGGAGFALSNPAMRKVIERRNAHLTEYDKYTTEEWAGDMVLGKVLLDVSVDLFFAWPHLQGDPVSWLDHNVTEIRKRPWCFGPITYHHMRESETREVWAFEQMWHRKNERTMRHRDVFRDFVLPKLSSRADNWDNLCLDSEPKQVETFEQCQARCESEPKCLQYSFAKGKCSTSTAFRLGIEASTECAEYSIPAHTCVRWKEGTKFDNGIQSGWMLKRIPKYLDDMDSMCLPEGGDEWALSRT